jgi:putative endonuclease
MNRKELGSWGEELAASFLRRKGYRILERNYSCRFGEIDLIASKGGYVCFVEVKLRKNADFAQAREFVTYAKQRRILTSASLWLAAHESDLQPRFDVIEIYAPEGESTRRAQIQHLENAFS